MSANRVSVEIRPASKPGSVKAYADVTVELTDGTIEIFGCAVVQKEGKQPFVGMPSRAGTSIGKYFPIVKLSGLIHQRLVSAVLEKFSTDDNSG